MDKKSIGGHVKEFTGDSQGLDEKGGQTAGDVQTIGNAPLTHLDRQSRTGNSRGGRYPIGSSDPKHPQKIRG
jgi:hypothetical protein